MAILTFEEFLDEKFTYDDRQDSGLKRSPLARERQKERNAAVQSRLAKEKADKARESQPDSEEEKRARKERYAAAGLKI